MARQIAHASSPPSPVFRLSLFGGWRLIRDGRDIHVPVREQRLVALLALRGRQRRTLVGGTLWPDVDEHKAQSSVRATLCALQRRAPGLVIANVAEVWLHEDVAVDVQVFLARVRGWLYYPPSRPPEAELSVVPAHGRLDGELMPGWRDDWVVIERERMHQLRLHALEALTDRLLARGNHMQALEVALTAVEIEPLRESSHRAVIRVHLAEGNTAEALRQYARFRVLLKRALKVEPSHHMAEILESIHARSRSASDRGIAQSMPIDGRPRRPPPAYALIQRNRSTMPSGRSQS